MLAFLVAAGSEQANASARDYEPDQVIVRLDPGATIRQINAAYGTTTLDTTLGGMGIYLLQTPNNEDPITFAQKLTSDPQKRILFAEPNFVAETPEGDGRHRAWGISSTSESSDPYAAGSLGLPCEAQISQGKGTTVAVLDTGAQLDHPALKANFKNVQRYDFVDKDTNPSDRPVGLDDDGDGFKDRLVGHGTHVAGIVDLVAPAAKIMPVRVLNSEGYGDVFTISKAIRYSWRNGAHVINLSLGTSRESKLLKQMVENAIQNGLVVTAAAGNSSTNVPHYPAAGDGVAAYPDGLVAVTSVDKEKKKSSFANYGLWVDLAAPGEDIRSAFPVSQYANWSGTSMATPFVSGQAALIHNVYGSLDPEGIETRIRAKVDPLPLLDPYAAAEMMGEGHANVCKSLS